MIFRSGLGSNSAVNVGIVTSLGHSCCGISIDFSFIDSSYHSHEHYEPHRRTWKGGHMAGAEAYLTLFMQCASQLAAQILLLLLTSCCILIETPKAMINIDTILDITD